MVGCCLADRPLVEKLTGARTPIVQIGSCGLRFCVLVWYSIGAGPFVWENPRTSMLWREATVVAVVEEFNLIQVILDMCRYGAERRKSIILLTSCRGHLALDRRCCCQFPHTVLSGQVCSEALGGWIARAARATSYPIALCASYVAIAFEHGSFAPPELTHVEGERVRLVIEVGRMLPADAGGGITTETQDGPGNVQSPWEMAVSNLSQRVRWSCDAAWRETEGRRINVCEAKAWMKLIRRRAARASCHGRRLISLWDSRVRHQIMARGRSSSEQLLHLQRLTLPHLAGGDMTAAGFWICSERMPMDGPSRGGTMPWPKGLKVPEAGRNMPLVTEATIRDWGCGQWRPTKKSEGDPLC
jgi:hypothetical protein